MLQVSLRPAPLPPPPPPTVVIEMSTEEAKELHMFLFNYASGLPSSIQKRLFEALSPSLKY